MYHARKNPAHLSPVERFNRPIIVLVTVCAHRRKPIFARDDAMQLLLRCWAEAEAWIVGRYIFMPDHIHLFCAPNASLPIPVVRWVKFWKSLATRSWPKREEYPIWRLNCWDRQMRSGEHYSERWQYVKNNPVRHGLVKNADEWRWQGEMNVLPW